MTLDTFFEKFDLFADAPDAVAKMRELVLQLAVKGKLVEQRPKELSARECIRKANKPLLDTAPDDSIETPAGWVALPLGCLIAANTGGGTPSKQNPSYWNGPIPWASVKDVQSDKYLVSTIDSITEEGLKDSSSNLIPPNRLIVVTRMGLGKLAINTIPVAINQDLRAIEPTTALDLDFAYLLFKSLKMVGSGVTVKGITVDKLHSMSVLLPPLAEQKRIVAKVDELMALCDRLEAQQQEREAKASQLARASLARFADAPTPANLDYLFHSCFSIPPSDLRKSILTLAVQGKLVPQDPNDESAQPAVAQIERERERLIAAKHFRRSQLPGPIDEGPFDIPDTWVWTHLGNAMLNVTDGFHSTPKTVESGVRYVTAKHVKPGLIDFDSCLYVSEDDFKEVASKTRPRKGDVLVVNIGAGSGLASIIETDFEFAFKNVAILNRPEEVDSKFLFNYLVFKRDEIFEEQTKGGAQPFLSLGLIRQIPFPLPPLAEQRRIVAKVEQLMALVDALETQLAASRTTAANLLSALVAELTSV